MFGRFYKAFTVYIKYILQIICETNIAIFTVIDNTSLLRAKTYANDTIQYLYCLNVIHPHTSFIQHVHSNIKFRYCNTSMTRHRLIINLIFTVYSDQLQIIKFI